MPLVALVAVRFMSELLMIYEHIVPRSGPESCYNLLRGCQPAIHSSIVCYQSDADDTG